MDDEWLNDENIFWEDLSWDEEWDEGRMVWVCDMPVHLSAFGEVLDLTAEAA